LLTEGSGDVFQAIGEGVDGVPLGDVLREVLVNKLPNR
jgi:hypothetical protein